MRLGTVPVWDLLMQGYRCITLCVSNAFRHGPGLGLPPRNPFSRKGQMSAKVRGQCFDDHQFEQQSPD